ncbi:hypothetical protein [Ruminococcus sp. NK3A76]|uniref:hypothetical protein n=1 Tax=Ruminococcus sp. NK3A76 TaxID=877411 RepID=UPI00048E1261|nr:hypothetical protein [Ruminococcus sp. NK3A76]
MKNRKFLALLAAFCCAVLVSCGDVKDSSKKDTAASSSQVQEANESKSGDSSSENEQQDSESEAEDLSKGDIYERAHEVAFKWCGFMAKEDTESAKALCTDEFAAELDDLYQKFFSVYKADSTNGLDYDLEDEPYIGINLRFSENDTSLGYVRVSADADNDKYLIDGFYMRDNDDKPVEYLDYYCSLYTKAHAQWLLVKTNERFKDAKIPDGEYRRGDGSEAVAIAKEVMEAAPAMFSIKEVINPESIDYTFTVEGGLITEASLTYEYSHKSYSAEYTA